MAENITLTEAQQRVARARTRRVELHGAPGSGKTYALAARAASLMEDGVRAHAILFAVACRSQVEPARAALAACMGSAAHDVPVLTAGEVAARILEADRTAEGNGRPAPRRLVPCEVNALNEDVKTMGTQPARLREMMKFFYRGLSELDDRDPDWLITLEERSILERARAFGREANAAIPCELENLACTRLEATAGAPTYAHVLVDGWTSLGMASQTMLTALASSSLAVAGYADDPGVVAHPYPRADTLTCANADRTGRADQADQTGKVNHTQAGETTVVDLGVSAQYHAAIETLVGDLPDDEFANVADWLSEQIRMGRAPNDLAVIAPNGVWAHRLASTCTELGIPVRTLARAPLSGDVRKPGRGGAEAALALLALAADGRDTLAWRMATGFGDPILGSNRWEALRRWCAARGASLADGLGELEGFGASEKAGTAEPFDGANWLGERVRSVRADIERLAGLEGPDLLERACQLVRADASELSGLLGNVEAHEDARSLASRLRDQGVDPAFPAPSRPSDSHVGGAVRIGCADAFVGVHVQACVLCGLVDGFMPGHACFDDRLPPDSKERALAIERTRFERARAVGTELVALSRFERDWLTEAEPARMEIARIRATQDPRGRVALVRPSAFWDDPRFQNV